MQENKAETASPKASLSPKTKRRRILFLAGPCIVLAATVFFYWTGGRYVETDNAYIQADKVIISAEVSGTIESIHIKENAQVKKGDPLFTIDNRSYLLRLDQAQAHLKAEIADIHKLKAEYGQKQNELKLAQVNLDFAVKELKRQSALAGNRVISEAKLDQARHEVDICKQKMGIINDEIAQILANLEGAPNTPKEKLPAYLLAKSEVEQAALDLERTVVRAPFSGLVTKLPKPGKHVSPGSAVLSLISDSNYWIEANFKETDLTRVRSGQPADIHVDTYPDATWEGTVASISPGTGSEFSVIPAQNATGNWVKVVQRIPVRIALHETSNDMQLRAGMSTVVTIDTGYHRPLPGFITALVNGFAATQAANAGE
ncbi:HlyD family secretion protein [Desulfogranum japonicum]|uniref:HlyD family secretion protein n=1 Tax=Desulfogranum japonicum TaxID=231447 RepID=UPI00040522C0|nr:HlyD family secretion protein [Desulfogranum japonicum]